MSTQQMLKPNSTTPTTTTKNNNKLSRYLMDMFEKSLFSDLSLVFIHPSFPFSMRFSVHRGIISQSPFLRKLLENMEKQASSSSTESTSDIMDSDNNTQDSNNEDQQDSINKHHNTKSMATLTTDEKGNMNTLTIDLSKALTHVGFVLAPFQHIVRRKWQKTSASSTATGERRQQHNMSPQLTSSHIRFALQWMYCTNKVEMMKSMRDQDTLRILSVAVLLDLHDLSQACVNRYTRQQLSLDSIMLDLETICQLPRGHGSYLQLRDASLLLLFRFGPEHATKLSQLPVDYMADVLAADLLFVGCEYERYCLLRKVLMSFMHSVGKITWTPQGPVDQDSKRLSGFVKPLSALTATQSAINNSLTADTIKSRKRKRIPSQELLDPSEIINYNNNKNPQQKTRLSFTALVPFETLVADQNSGGVIDKATVLSYLLRSTIIYSNMTFDQLSTVRADGIVDESNVFKALWQREALERLLFPRTHPHHHSSQEQQQNSSQHDRSVALDEYFDVDGSGDEQEKRKRLLLGTPRFRFKASVTMSSPSIENGWTCEELQVGQFDSAGLEDLGDTFDDDSDGSDGSVWSVAAADNNVDQLQVGGSGSNETSNNNSKTVTKGRPYKLYKKMFYSQAETILGISYRVQIEAQVMPRHRLLIQEEYDQVEEDDEVSKLFSNDRHNADENIMVCRFELQRDLKQIVSKESFKPIKKEKEAKNKKKSMIPTAATSNSSAAKPTGNNTSSAGAAAAAKSTTTTTASASNVSVSRSTTGNANNSTNSNDTAAAVNSTTTTIASAATTSTTITTTESTANTSNSATSSNTTQARPITIPTTAPSKTKEQQQQKKKQHQQQLQSQEILEKTKIHYWIYCLNRHDGIIENGRIDPEDRVFVAVTEQCERENGVPGEMEPGYIGQVLIDDNHTDLSKPITIDTAVALEIFGFHDEQQENV